jgi:hypothetical protein
MPSAISAADRAARVRTALIMGGYQPDSAKGNALIEILVDLVCWSRATNLPFEGALERARAVSGQTLPEQRDVQEQPRELWRCCRTCRRWHPAWAACLQVEPDESQYVVVVDDPSGRRAAHVVLWYGRLPGALATAEQRMQEHTSFGPSA